MIPVHAAELTTPKKYLLHGLWFGPRRARTVFVLVHGLGSSLWKHSFFELAKLLSGKGTAVLLFNNRGHDRISALYRKGPSKKRAWAGGAMETFTDCFYYIQGAINFARRQKAKQIYLIGHSTGCQKSVYWAHKKKGRGVKGVVLLAPMSDYSVALRDEKPATLKRAVKLARALVRRGKKHELLPQALWPHIDDAQRFLSLYTPESVEELFTYAQPKKTPRVLRSLRTPMLVALAEKDEFGDRPARKIADWFMRNITKGEVAVIPRVKHSFRGGERQVAAEIKKWMDLTR